MVFLRKVTIHEQNYFYLFRCESNPFKKYKKYIGTSEPSKAELKKLEKEFLDEIKKNPDTQEIHEKNIIALLQKIQEQNKYVSEEAIIKLSKEMGIPAVNLYGVLTFYSQFKLKEPGKNHICVCRGTACHVKKSDELLKTMEEVLQIKAGETTKNKEFSLEAVNCIGACAKAPAIMINKQVFGELDKDKTRKLILKMKAEIRQAQNQTQNNTQNSNQNNTQSQIQNNTQNQIQNNNQNAQSKTKNEIVAEPRLTQK